MENIIKNYNPTIIKYNNNDTCDNILNNYPIFIINLKDNQERRDYINYIMNKMKINYNLIIVNKINNDIYEKIKKQDIRTDNNKLGCIISHLFCIKQCIDSNYTKFIIFEDDIIFHKRFNELCTFDLLNEDFDMLMLGACDFNVSYNKQLVYKQLNDLYTYKPNKQALGAHANMYSISFAKILYEHKIKTPFFEFDVDFSKFYNKYKIYVCMPNLIVCELTTTNLNHNFGYNAIKYNTRIKNIFPKDFTYKEYNYVTIDFINYIKNNYDLVCESTLNEIVNNYVKGFNISEDMKAILSDNLICSGYSIEDIKNMYNK